MSRRSVSRRLRIENDPSPGMTLRTCHDRTPPKELIDRGVRLAIDSGRRSRTSPKTSTCRLRRSKAVGQAEADPRLRGPPTSAEREEIKQLRRENYKLWCANEILKVASVRLATELDRDFRSERVFGSLRERFGVEPISRVVGVSASAYYHRATGGRSARSVRDERLWGSSARAAPR